LHTLGESTDWVYTVAWSPDGKTVVAGGVDRTIRTWEVSADQAHLINAVFAHSGPIVRLVFSKDGKTLFSVGEDRVIKSWDPGRMVERATSAKLVDAPLTLAIRPDAKQLAVGRFDGVLAVVDPATMKTQSEPLPAKPKPPHLERIEPGAATRGTTVRVRLTGKHLADLSGINSTIKGSHARLVEKASENSVVGEIAIPKSVTAGEYELTVTGPAGRSAPIAIIVDAFQPEKEQPAAHGSPGSGQIVTLPATLIGSIARAGEIDWYRFPAKSGDELGVHAQKASGSNLEAALMLADERGRTLAESENGLLGYRFAESGTYALGIRDRDYRGDPNMSYRLHVGDLPVVNRVFPQGLQRGTEAEIQVEGANLGTARTVKMRVPESAAIGSRLPVPLSVPQGFVLGSPSIVVGEFPETRSKIISVPGTANGRVDGDDLGGVWKFEAKKGQRLLLEINARRLGSPLDSTLEILDAAGQPLPRATLRCLSKTYVVFRDHDSSGTGIRIETWPDLAVNDYLLLGGELVRINELPKNPDDDCQFFGEGGKRLGYLGTTPTHHAMGEPLYKVGIFPPGSTFPANGLPVVTLYYRNDDGGPGFGKDSMLTFDPPADGEYQVRVRDARGLAGPQFAYRLTIRPPRPDFTVSFNPGSPAVAKGSARAIGVTAHRMDGFDGAIAIHLENLPPGFSAPDTTIPAGENNTSFALYCGPDATVPPDSPPLRLVATAKIGAREIVHDAVGGLPRIVDSGDLITTTEQESVTLRPGGDTRLTVKIERRNGHTGRVPLEVRGLPHGIRVLDIGLNGILITERETTRTIVIHADSWVTPTEHPFVVLSRSERKNTEHAAKSVLLRVLH
jgi:hypothetical protein